MDAIALEKIGSTMWGVGSYFVPMNCNTWISLRTANESQTSSFRLWCTNQTEYFDLRRDPYELDNQAGVKGEHDQGEFSEMKRLLVRAR